MDVDRILLKLVCFVVFAVVCTVLQMVLEKGEERRVPRGCEKLPFGEGQDEVINAVGK